MTDPNQNQQNPGNWSPDSGGWNQNPYGPPQGQPWQPGPQQNMYGAPGGYGMPGQPGQPENKGGSGKLVAIIVGALVVVIALAVVGILALRGDDDDDDTTAADTSRSAPLDDTLDDSGDSGDLGGAGDNSLPSRWSGLVPASIAGYLSDCHDTSFRMNDVESSEMSSVDGTSCTIDGPSPLSGQQVDILAEDARIVYLEDALNGDIPGASGTVFDRNGAVTVGTSDVEPPGTTLYYLDADTSASVEIIGFADDSEARAAARTLDLI